MKGYHSPEFLLELEKRLELDKRRMIAQLQAIGCEVSEYNDTLLVTYSQGMEPQIEKIMLGNKPLTPSC